MQRYWEGGSAMRIPDPEQVIEKYIDSLSPTPIRLLAEAIYLAVIRPVGWALMVILVLVAATSPIWGLLALQWAVLTIGWWVLLVLAGLVVAVMFVVLLWNEYKSER